MKKRFGVLRVLANVLKVLGIIAAAGAVLGGIGTLIASFVGGDLWSMIGYDSGAGILVGLMGSFAIVVVGLVYAVMLYGYGELLMLLLSMEDNTFRTVKLLEDVVKEEE